MSTFDLWELWNDEFAHSATPDVYEIATRVGKRVPDEHLREALDASLRKLAPNMAHSAPVSRAPGTPKKSAALRWLAQRISVDPDSRTWKFLGDCTRDEVLRAAAIRREHAAATVAQAERYESLAGAMAAHQADVVADLPEDVIAEVLS